MSILMGIIGIVIVLAVAFLMSNDKKLINYKGIAVMLVIQLAISAFMMNTSIGRKVLDFITSVFTKILSLSATKYLNYMAHSLDISVLTMWLPENLNGHFTRYRCLANSVTIPGQRMHGNMRAEQTAGEE